MGTELFTPSSDTKKKMLSDIKKLRKKKQKTKQGFHLQLTPDGEVIRVPKTPGEIRET